MMKKIKFLMVMSILFGAFSVVAQDESQEREKLSYYEERGQQDAEYEQSLEMDKEEDEKDFWEDQKQYEKDLKKRDKKAYKAYMKGKKDAYAEHAAHCNAHCHHSDYYHHHTTFYYSYHRNYYPSRSSGVRTGIRVGTPSVRVGIF